MAASPGCCDVCMGKEGSMERPALLPSLLDKHLGILVSDKVSSCRACIQLLHMWDDFSNQAKRNLKVTHPRANFDLAHRPARGPISKSSMPHTAVLEIDDDSDSDDVMICEDLVPARPSSGLQSVTMLDLHLQCNFEPDRVVPPVVWETPCEDPVCEPDKDPLSPPDPRDPLDPLNVLPVSVKKEYSDLQLPLTLQVKSEENKKTAVSVEDFATAKYSCFLCHQKFISRSSLQVHMRSKHRKKLVVPARVFQNIMKGSKEKIALEQNANLEVKDALSQVKTLTTEVMTSGLRGNPCSEARNMNDKEESSKKVRDTRQQKRSEVSEALPELKTSTIDEDSCPQTSVKLRGNNLTFKRRILELAHLCQSCCKSFQSREILALHMKTVHSKPLEQTQFQCPFCFFNYMNLKTLERHISLMHPDPSTFVKKKNNVVCDICGVNLCSKKLLRFHILKVHADMLNKRRKLASNETYSCTACRLQFDTHVTLVKHVTQTHQLTKAHAEQSRKLATSDAYSCTNCQLKFDTIEILNNHIRQAHSVTKADGELSRKLASNVKAGHEVSANITKYYKCKICSQLCTSREAIQRHKEDKHAVRNTRYSLASQEKFSCAPCSQSFSSKLDFEAHKQKCHHVKPNPERSCHICNRKFKSRHGLTQHVKSHRNVAREVRNLLDNGNVLGRGGRGHEKLLNNGDVIGRGGRGHLKLLASGENKATVIGGETDKYKSGRGLSQNVNYNEKSGKESNKFKIYEDKYKHRDGMFFCNFCMTSRNSLPKIVFHLKHHHLPRNYVAQATKALQSQGNVESREEMSVLHLRGESGEKQRDLNHRLGSERSEERRDLRQHRETKRDEGDNSEERRDVKHNGGATEREQSTEEIFLQLISNGNFACTLCAKVLNTMDDIYHHNMRYHEDKKMVAKRNFSIMCNICADGESITSTMSLGLHIETRHKLQSSTDKSAHCSPASMCNNTSVIIFDCSLCNKKFYTKTAMKFHVRLSHLIKSKT